MAKYSKAAQKGVKSAIKRMEKGTLRSGSTGKKVTNPKQAIAIGLSQAKKKGAKVPVKKKAAPKKVIKKNTAVKKATPKKAVAKKSIAKKIAIKKPATKKVAAKKVAPKKAVAKKAVAKKAIAKKAVTKNITAKKIASANPAPVKTFISPLRAVPPQTEQADKITDTTSLPQAKELSEELVEKTANTNIPGPAIEEPSGNGLTVPAKIEDPLTSFDKHVFQKATTKGDPHSKLHLSSVNKSTIRPSGKKPLWRK
ncbi:DUF6496 domain-containing protein [Ferruginibacter sp.]